MRCIPHQQAIGNFLFAAQVFRPDIYIAVNEVSYYNHNPEKIHWIAHWIEKDGNTNGLLCSRLDQCINEKSSVTGYVFTVCGEVT